MKKLLIILMLNSLTVAIGHAQSAAKIKAAMETNPDILGYLKKSKKKYYIDTIAIANNTSFMGLADSLAYKGKVGKVYGPFPGENILVKILMKAPNTFYHVQHILLDTAVFTKKFADSTANIIIEKVKSKVVSFKEVAASYSADYSTAQKSGDLGWFVQGAMIPELDALIVKRKKGDIFKVWTASGLHIIRLPDAPKKDVGYALMLRVVL